MLLIVATSMLAACSGGHDEPVDLQLRDLVRFAQRYDGDLVTTTGVVHTFPNPRHYWIEDQDVNRVEIEPQSAVADHVNQRVRVVGRFHYDRGQGRRLEVRETTTLGERQ